MSLTSASSLRSFEGRINPVKPLNGAGSAFTGGNAMTGQSKRRAIETCGGSERREQNSKDVYDTVPHRVAGQICNGVQAEFAHQVGAMRLCCFDAEIQRDRNFFAGLTLGE
jgi:hypothetical protein